jgi:hypothetical protein
MDNDNKKTADSFIFSIENIIKRPGIFMINRVEDIENVFLGYDLAVSGCCEDKSAIIFMSEFKAFVNKEFESEQETNWARLIRFSSAGDLHSLELFSKLFHQFVAMRKT